MVKIAPMVRAATFLPILICTLLQVSVAEERSMTLKRPDKPIYLITRNEFVSGGGDSPAKRGDLLTIEVVSSNQSSINATVPGQLPLRTNLRLFSGGQEVGSAQVIRMVDFHCVSKAGVAKVKSSMAFRKGVYGLASESKNLRSHQRWDKNITPSQRASIVKYVAEFLGKKYGNKLSEGSIKVWRARLTKASRDSLPMILASVTYSLGDSSDHLLIHGRNANVTVPNFEVLFHNHQVDDPSASVSMSYVDQLDIDSDGTDELVIEVRGYESQEYQVLKHDGKSWTKVWTSVGAGC